MSQLQKYLIASLAILPLSALAEFSGSWHIEYPKRSTVTSTADEFNLFLIQEGSTICGFHYGTARGKAKIDWGWASDEKPTVYGHVNDSGPASVTLHSSQSDTPVQASITINEGKLIWLAKGTDADLPPTIPRSVALARAAPKNHELRELKSCSAKDT
jgi:hypothetical protein